MFKERNVWMSRCSICQEERLENVGKLVRNDSLALGSLPKSIANKQSSRVLGVPAVHLLEMLDVYGQRLR